MTFARVISMLTLAAYAAAICLSSGALVLCRNAHGNAQVEIAGLDYACCHQPVTAHCDPGCCDDPDEAEEGPALSALTSGCSDTPLCVVAADQVAGRHVAAIAGFDRGCVADLPPVAPVVAVIDRSTPLLHFLSAGLPAPPVGTCILRC